MPPGDAVSGNDEFMATVMLSDEMVLSTSYRSRGDLASSGLSGCAQVSPKQPVPAAWSASWRGTNLLDLRGELGLDFHAALGWSWGAYGAWKTSDRGGRRRILIRDGNSVGCLSGLASTPAVDRDLVVEGPRAADRADEIGLRWFRRPFFLRLPGSAGGGSP